MQISYSILPLKDENMALFATLCRKKLVGQMSSKLEEICTGSLSTTQTIIIINLTRKYNAKLKNTTTIIKLSHKMYSYSFVDITLIV